ncbi:MAG TPA: class I SAM-dependent methyltransferase [Chitinophagaceae bacterium]|nr:class I SAM-dependent methyltransferase [Chitinophagaceae bacterium]
MEPIIKAANPKKPGHGNFYKPNKRKVIMEQQLEQIREQQRESWNKFSPGWKKWDNLFMDFLKPMGDEIIAQLRLGDNFTVLDVAAGTGEPGLSIASRIPTGKVFITDLSEEMLDIAEENAIRKGIINIETVACDVCDLPFADDSFDAISCRFGFMFFPDMLLAAKEMVRVLKPGGRLATSVWNVPEKNFWITATMGTISKNMQLPAPPPGAPGMFRCAKEGFIAELFEQAGLKNISTGEVTGKLKAKTAETYWHVMNDVAAPVVAALSNADAPLKEKIRKEVFEAVNQRYPDSNILIESSAWIVSGEK